MKLRVVARYAIYLEIDPVFCDVFEIDRKKNHCKAITEKSKGSNLLFDTL